jgi:undecaprenyl phosphate N,N'-diacetylbacillosamine 1-phosphate transferase
MYIKHVKPLMDFSLALFGLLILSPLFLILMILLYFTNQGEPFFLQERPGKKTKIFKIIKFKTMNDNKDIFGELLPFEKRVTKIGSWIRKYSLDEIPQLINVLFGDMSIIGPRPLLIKYLPLYNSFQKKRHDVKPGITGWAQVNGRNSITWEEKFNLDIYYIEHISIIFDFKIFLLTIKKVLLKDGVNSDENLNMEEFTGTKIE